MSRFVARPALLCLGALSLASAGHAQDWDQKIAAARDNAARLEQMAYNSAPIDQMYYPEFQDMCDADLTWVRGNCSHAHPSVRR